MEVTACLETKTMKIDVAKAIILGIEKAASATPFKGLWHRTSLHRAQPLPRRQGLNTSFVSMRPLNKLATLGRLAEQINNNPRLKDSYIKNYWRRPTHKPIQFKEIRPRIKKSKKRD